MQWALLLCTSYDSLQILFRVLNRDILLWSDLLLSHQKFERRSQQRAPYSYLVKSSALFTYLVPFVPMWTIRFPRESATAADLSFCGWFSMTGHCPSSASPQFFARFLLGSHASFFHLLSNEGLSLGVQAHSFSIHALAISFFSLFGFLWCCLLV